MAQVQVGESEVDWFRAVYCPVALEDIVITGFDFLRK
jgi:hypothetical protein